MIVIFPPCSVAVEAYIAVFAMPVMERIGTRAVEWGLFIMVLNPLVFLSLFLFFRHLSRSRNLLRNRGGDGSATLPKRV